MPEFLDLGRQRAGPALPKMRIDKPRNSAKKRAREAFPVNGRVLPWIVIIEKVTVFHEEKCSNYKAWDLVKSPVAPLWKTARVKRRAVAIPNGKTCLCLFPEYGIAMTRDEAFQAGRKPGLSPDQEISGLQSSDEIRKLCIAKSQIVRSVMRKSNLRTWPCRHLESHLPRQPREHERFDKGTSQLENDPDTRRAQEQCSNGDPSPDPAQIEPYEERPH